MGRKVSKNSTPATPISSPPGFEYPTSELVFALVGGVGADLEWVENELRNQLNKVNYRNAKGIRLSQILHNFQFLDDRGRKIIFRNAPEDERILSHMEAGNILRQETERGDILALLAIQEIYETRMRGRARITCDKCQQFILQQPIARKAYILRSLKHPEEVYALRRVYGPGFFLVAVHSPRDARQKELAVKIARDHGETENSPNYPTHEQKAEFLIDKDTSEPDQMGQQLRSTFHLADLFISVSDDDESKTSASHSLRRFVELIFGNTEHTPSPDESAMFHAQVAAARSGSLSRQVGAAVVTGRGEILGIGCNEVPRFGGGQYLPGDSDRARDVDLGMKDFSDEQKEIMVTELILALKKNNWITGKEKTMEKALKVLEGTRLLNVIEFTRAAHAEMEAILAAGRKGIAVVGQNLFSTTFPCHDCAKIIIASGIDRVVYIEPYPKSLASKLHEDAIIVEKQREIDQHSPRKKVLFEPFVGIGPRRYLDLFSLTTSVGSRVQRKDRRGNPIQWSSVNASLRLPMLPTSYLQRERQALVDVGTVIEKAMQP